MMDFQIGQSVDLNVKLKSHILGEENIVIKFAGNVTKTPHWLGIDYVSVYTGNPEYPVSHIKKETIIGYTIPKSRSDTRFFHVTSKKKNSVYNVISEKGSVICDCIGFQYRKTCKHSIAVKDYISKNA